MNKSILAVAVVSLLPYASFTQAQQSSADETVVVTANRFEQSISSTLAPVVVVTKEEIQSTQAKSIEEVLRRLPGIQVATNGGYGQTASVYIRGSESDHTLILVNGVRINSATTGSTAIGSLPLNGIERVEYIRGPRTAVYGSDAIGGVINIITSYTGEETELWVEGGSDDYKKFAASTAHELGDKAWFKLALNNEKTDGFSATNTKSSYFNSDNDGYEHTDVMAELGYIVSEKISLKFSSNYSEGDSEYDQGEKEQVLLSYSLSGSYMTEQFSSEVIAAASQDQSAYVGSTGNYETNRVSLAWQNAYQLNTDFLLLGGVDWVNDDVSETTADYAETSRSNLGVYTSGVYTNNNLQTELSLRFDDNEQYGGYTTWQVSSGYRITPTYRVSAMAGKAFKAPTFNDLYYPGSWYNGTYYPSSSNPNLTPEESLNFELALDADLTVATLRAAVYQNKISGLIAKSSSSSIYENISEAKIQGFELVGEFTTGHFFHSASIDLMDPINEETNKELVRRSKFSAKWNISYQHDAWNFDLSYLYRGKSYDDSANTVELDAYTLVDFATHYYITDELIVRGRIANLFDEHYETAYGYNTQERSYYVGLNYKF